MTPKPLVREGRRGLLGEHRRQTETTGPDVGENPYWDEGDEPPPPELGCIRRGLCCRTSPGWFGPGEVEQAAALLGLAPDAFVRQYCIVDRFEGAAGPPVFVFAPVKLDRFGAPALPPASLVDDWYRLLKGPCVFYDGHGCRIYAARPVECRAYLCSQPPERNLSHDAVAELWRTAARAAEAPGETAAAAATGEAADASAPQGARSPGEAKA